MREVCTCRLVEPYMYILDFGVPLIGLLYTLYVGLAYVLYT